jgi:hypothetical protein
MEFSQTEVKFIIFTLLLLLPLSYWVMHVFQFAFFPQQAEQKLCFVVVAATILASTVGRSLYTAG